MTEPTPRHYAPRHLIWSELTRTELIEARDKDALVLIPTGSIEQHADHLPVETDALLSAAVAELAAARMTDTPVVVAPCVAFGFTPHHLSWPGTISLRLETYMAMLTDIVRSILDAGFPRAIFVNGHGGNSAPLRALVGQLTTDGYAIGMVDYFAPSEASYGALMTGGLPRVGHACEHETAMMLDMCGDDSAARIEGKLDGLPARLVQPWVAPGHPFDPVAEYGAGWAAIFHADDCGYWGDPGVATRATGAALAELTVANLAEFLEFFARTPLRIGIARDPARPGFAPPTVAPASSQ